MEANKNMKDNVVMLQIEQDAVREEQEKVIAQLEEVLHLLKTKQVKNKESLAIMKKPLDDLRSCLKYLPTDSCFDHLPNEITANILNYLSDSNAVIAAGACLKWKGILAHRFAEKEVLFSVKVTAPKMDVKLSIYDSVKIVDATLVTQGLTSVLNFSMMRDEDAKLQDLFRGLGVDDDVTIQMEPDGLDHTNTKLINKLAQEPSEIKLKLLTLNGFEVPDELNIEEVNAMCNVENVKIRFAFLRLHKCARGHTKREPFVKQLLENILTRPVKIKALRVNINYYNSGYIDYRALIDPDSLKKLFKKMTFLFLEGLFTSAQEEAARTLTAVHVQCTGVRVVRGGSSLWITRIYKR